MMSFLEKNIIFGNMVNDIKRMINIDEDTTSLVGKTTSSSDEAIENKSRIKLNNEKTNNNIEKKRLQYDTKKLKKQEDDIKARNLRTQQKEDENDVRRMKVAMQTGQDNQTPLTSTDNSLVGN